MTDRARTGWSRALTLVLTLTCLGLFASTVLLYLGQERGRQALAVSVRTSGWVAYQAQLELVKSLSALELASLDPSPQKLRNVGLRLAILRSRLPLLYASEEGRLLPDIQNYRELLQSYERSIDQYLDAPSPEPGSEEVRAILWNLHESLRPLLPTMQTVLQSAIAYNEEIYKREQVLAENPAILPLALLFLSGGLLLVFLFLQTVRDRQRLQVTQEAQAEAAAARENLLALIEATPAVIVVFDPADLSISFVNGFGLNLIAPSLDHPDWARFLLATRVGGSDCGGGGGAVGSFSFQRSDGGIVALRGRCSSVVWEHRDQCLIALADTTQVRDAEYQLLQAAKLSTLGEMASAIAHEINQPLAVIRMAAANARRLQAKGETDSLLAKLERIDEQVERAKRIIDQVRRYGRNPTMRPERFQITRAIDLAISFVAEQYRLASIRLVLEIGLPDNLVVEGEQTLFEQVIVNLLLNARDAFEAEGIADDQRSVTISASLVGGQIRIGVSDDAGGIAEAIIGQVFEPFTTTKPDDKGTGLGLALSRSTVRRMNGEISVENVGRGAQFTIVLPVVGSVPGERSAA